MSRYAFAIVAVLAGVALILTAGPLDGPQFMVGVVFILTGGLCGSFDWWRDDKRPVDPERWVQLRERHEWSDR